mmetsp:Transcript_74447/g.170759  ORF Transcript_74447/g.170759 Transcript_74447/m.170759 type:complete len:213 (-) Transcript_74447:176-814(-)
MLSSWPAIVTSWRTAFRPKGPIWIRKSSTSSLFKSCTALQQLRTSAMAPSGICSKLSSFRETKYNHLQNGTIATIMARTNPSTISTVKVPSLGERGALTAAQATVVIARQTRVMSTTLSSLLFQGHKAACGAKPTSSTVDNRTIWACESSGVVTGTKERIRLRTNNIAPQYQRSALNLKNKKRNTTRKAGDAEERRGATRFAHKVTANQPTP